MTGKLLGLLLVLTFIAPVATSFVVLKHQKKQVKREIKWRIIAGIEKEELVLLKFSSEEKKTTLDWKHAKEFGFQGEMYDIVESKIEGDTTWYWCWWDHEETKLNKQLSKLVSLALGNDPKRQENQKNLQNFFKSLYFLGSTETSVLPVEDKNTDYFSTPNLYRSNWVSPPAPPPKLV